MSSVVSSIFGGPAPGQVTGSATAATGEQANQRFDEVNQGLTNQAGFLQAVQAQNGLGNQTQVYNQLQGVADGTGANPAQAMLNQATGANVANQAALMAGQRGSSANAGLIGRQAAQQGANTQQQAAGQGATLQANQSLNALTAAGNMANTQAGQQANATNAYTNSALQGQQNVLGALTSQNQINSGAQQGNAQMQGNLLGNLAGAAGSALQLAEGGAVPEAPKAGPTSLTAQYFAQGGKVPAMVSPGEQYLPPQAAKAVAKGDAKPLSVGERIPGKPKVAGNSYANDVVPKTLTTGGVVIPNSIMQGKDAEKKAAEFVRQVLSKKQGLPAKGKK